MNALIRRLRTPQHVQRWFLTLKYNKKDTMRTIHGVTKHREAHCLEAALSTAAILEHHGYPPLILDLDSAGELAHTLFLFKQRGKFGAVGWSRDVGLNGRKPVFKTTRSLVQSYVAPYIDKNEQITAYGVLDLRTLKNDNWRHSPDHVWYVEKALINMPHKKLKTSPRVLRRWRQQYIAFQKLYPGKQPTYYPNQQNWM